MEDLSKSKITTSSSMDAYASASSSSGSHYSTALTKSIEESKVHWSILSQEDSESSYDPIVSEGDSEWSDDQIVADNIEVYESLRLHPQWGRFFFPFNKDVDRIFEVQDKFAEGAQAEVFNVTFHGPMKNEGGRKMKWVLKVFKKGFELQQLQSQWPHGYLQWNAQDLRKTYFRTFVAFVARGMLLPTGQFAFLIKKEESDLRTLIDRNTSRCNSSCGPFPKWRMETSIYQIASGMDWLHKHNIIHRDIKASNVLVDSDGDCYVADFECSIGVVGTGFWRDPQILQACKDRNVNRRPDLFTRACDVYSYGMTCYEILMGKMPFEDLHIAVETLEDLVIAGQRPEMPAFIDNWIKDLLSMCWEANRDARPSFEEILNIIFANTISPFTKLQHTWHMKVNDDEIKPLLGCDKLSHGLEMKECSPYERGVYVCKLCLKEGQGQLYHCSSCGDFDLHPGCANILGTIQSFLHPHSVHLLLGFAYIGKRIKCGACQLDIVEGNHYNSYKCMEKECDFDIHIHCAKYARTISHHLHKEHELVLIYSLTCMRVGAFSQACNSCNIKLNPLEIVYSCIECGFNVHPHCTIGRLVCKSW